MSLIDPSTVGLVSMALDATALRQRAIAHNIANAHTPGFQRVGVSFESRLGALQNVVRQGGVPSLSSLRDVRPTLEAVGAPGDAVPLDMEVAALSENTLQQQTLLKMLNKHYAILSSAINEGKR